MKIISLSSLVIAAVVISAPLGRAEPDATAQKIFQNLMAAVVSDNLDSFTAEGDANMKAAISKAVLDSVSKMIAPRAQQGYDTQYLGEMKKQAYQVYLWRLRFKDG